MGFLDPAERVVDMVLTEVGKISMMRGELRFVYWVPFDDEVDYRLSQTLLETPLIREATMGYRGLNMVEEDTTNVHRPMYSASPGVGLTAPLPQLSVDATGSLVIRIDQQKIERFYSQKAADGTVIAAATTVDGFDRKVAGDSTLVFSYSGSYDPGFALEGVLCTVYQTQSDSAQQILTGSYTISGSTRYQEVLPTRNSNGDVAYRNDLVIKVVT